MQSQACWEGHCLLRAVPRHQSAGGGLTAPRPHGGQQSYLPHRPVGTKGAVCLENSPAEIWKDVQSQCITFIIIIFKFLGVKRPVMTLPVQKLWMERQAWKGAGGRLSRPHFTGEGNEAKKQSVAAGSSTQAPASPISPSRVPTLFLNTEEERVREWIVERKQVRLLTRVLV